MAQVTDIRHSAKLKAAILADRVFDLQHEIRHGHVSAAQLKSLDDITTQLNSLTRFAKTDAPGQRCAHCFKELTPQNRAPGFGSLCTDCEALTR
jgi:hypothetical protein